MKRFSFLVLAVLILLSVPVVIAAPPLPSEYFGNVTLNDKPAPVGTEVRAVINGTTRDEITVIEEGLYGGSGMWDDKLIVQVSEEEYACGCTIPIVFTINGVPADQTSTFSSGQTVSLDLSGQCPDSAPPAPVADFTAYPREGEIPLTVEFRENVSHSWSYDEFRWDFGDGITGTGYSAHHTYVNPGLYNVTLTVNSTFGSSSVTMNGYVNATQQESPATDFYGTPLSGDAPLEVEFSDITLGVVETRWWDFGDGTVAWANETPWVKHTYSIPGIFTVSLTAGNNGGDVTATKEEYIEVLPSGFPPDARFSLSPMMGYAPLSVLFTDRSTGGPLAWDWDFDDGNMSSDANPANTYSTAGLYVVTLTVANSGGTDSYVSTVWVR